MYKTSIFIFRRDLRTVDNTGLLAAMAQSHSVIPCFFIDPRQFLDHPYLSLPARSFLIESLLELDATLQKYGGRLYLFCGTPEEILPRVLCAHPLDAIFLNRDYTPFSRSRDTALKSLAAENNVALHDFPDALLTEPAQVTKDDGNPYSIFTPFFKRASRLSIARPDASAPARLFSAELPFSSTVGALDEYRAPSSNHFALKGGRSEGLARLENIASLGDYSTLRDIPSRQGTSLLSAHHKFGTISIRETYYRTFDLFGLEHSIIRELFWRDFFTHIGFHFPHVFEGAFHRVYDHLEWSDDTRHFDAWCEGRTGFPIVDAGMRELNETGLMHNRVRMIVSSFLTKDLHLSWRRGERYFATRLIDYDPAVNNGSWQWAASTGCDAQPYFRIFNPWLQQKKFDPEATYIRRWVPELRERSVKEIHQPAQSRSLFGGGYPDPIVEHAREKIRAEDRYRTCLKSGRS